MLLLLLQLVMSYCGNRAAELRLHFEPDLIGLVVLIRALLVRRKHLSLVRLPERVDREHLIHSQVVQRYGRFAERVDLENIKTKKQKRHLNRAVVSRSVEAVTNLLGSIRTGRV